MKRNIRKPKLNVTAVNRKAFKAGTNTGFVAGLLGAAFGMAIRYAATRGCNSALFGALIIGPLTGITLGLFRAAFVWCEVALTLRRRFG